MFNINIKYPCLQKSVSFKGFNDCTHNIKSENAMDYCIHETHFFRNLETLTFTRDYLLKHFPNGTHIAGFGCSNGEEEYSLAMLLKEENADKKYKITGYDIASNVVNKAQSGPFEIKGAQCERLIKDNSAYKENKNKFLRQLFFECFEPVPERVFSIRGRDKSEIQSAFGERIEQEQDPAQLLKWKCYKEIATSLYDYKKDNSYMPKWEVFGDILDFKCGDINKISKILNGKEQTGAIIFKNAWYHILGRNYVSHSSFLNLAGAENVMKQCSDILPEGGLFVVGNLEQDHLYDGQRGHVIKQDGKKIRVYDDTLFHRLLRKNGFQPVFYERVKDTQERFYMSGDIYLPSVWQKIKTDKAV